ncbi:MAG TPA: sigma-70 family RNA polymerase sigma factor [Polyangiaceae bacterium]|jgi:RNA polymerase sigma-70 factor (ECF subfamily)
MNETDEALYARWIAGDMRAFDRLYARFERPLFGFARAFVRDTAEAEDVLHETFMAALRERPRELRSFRAWIFGVARHICLNRARTQKRAENASRAIDGPRFAPPADEAIDAHRRAAALERAIDRLPTSLAELYRLRATGLSYDELAELLQIPIGTVKSRMHEMVMRLKEEVSR